MKRESEIFQLKQELEALKKEIALFKNTINGANVGIWEWNFQTGEQTINERWAEIIGYTMEELEPISIETWERLVHPADLELTDPKTKEMLRTQNHSTVYFRMKHKDGRWVWIESNGVVNTLTPNGQPLLVSGSHLDITDRKLAEDAVKENERRLNATQEIAHIGSWEVDLESKTMWASEEAFRIYGLERQTGKLDLTAVQALIKGDHREKLDIAFYELIFNNHKYDIEFIVINGFTGQEIAVRSRAILKYDDQGNPIGVIGTIQDISEEKKRQEELLYISYHDQLTGLYNRRYLKEELARLDRLKNLPLTVVLCDVNGLKIVNDTFGHDYGDLLLQQVAGVLQSECREGDILARYGGDEFAMILPRTNSENGEVFVRKVKELISKEKIGAFEISVSFGFATKNYPEQDIDIVSKIAEDHMYNQKLYENRSMRSKTVDLIINTLYEKNNREMLHSKRVSSLCEAFAAYLKKNKDEIARIKVAGLMHDIGKIGIGEKILNKPGPLIESEWEEIKRHSEIGYRILNSVREFSEVSIFVLEHQEKWDGTGYPKGLKGKEISLEARIISLADTYDAMTRARAYGRVFTKDEALTEIEKCAGTQFDPDLAHVFIKMLKKTELNDIHGL
jgi:diguanylate cyclase (GGDEF)-like protein/PAS domain S-box-containing protein